MIENFKIVKVFEKILNSLIDQKVNSKSRNISKETRCNASVKPLDPFSMNHLPNFLFVIYVSVCVSLSLDLEQLNWKDNSERRHSRKASTEKLLPLV
jgi:hypothetical protein